MNNWARVAMFGALGLVVAPAGMYAPGSPIQKRRAEVESARLQVMAMDADVARLRAVEGRQASLERQMAAAQEQLASLEAMLPGEKHADDFMRMLQQAAAESGVRIRRITSKPLVAREYHYEMPFEMEVEGSYFALQSYFSTLSSTQRITNVSDVALTGFAEASARPKHAPVDTTVNATMTVTTYFANNDKGAQAESNKKKQQ